MNQLPPLWALPLCCCSFKIMKGSAHDHQARSGVCYRAPELISFGKYYCALHISRWLKDLMSPSSLLQVQPLWEKGNVEENKSSFLIIISGDRPDVQRMTEQEEETVCNGKKRFQIGSLVSSFDMKVVIEREGSIYPWYLWQNVQSLQWKWEDQRSQHPSGLRRSHYDLTLLVMLSNCPWVF